MAQSLLKPGPGQNPPSNNLWIGNVSPDVSETEFRSLLEKHGKIDSVTLYPSRNYAFVYFREIESAKAAKQALQGFFLRGNTLKIEFAKSAKPCKSLWVAGISPSIKKEILEKEFYKYGKVEAFRFLRDRCTAYVDYATLDDAANALKNMNGRRIGGEQLRVDYVRSQPTKKEQGPDGQFPSKNMGPSDFQRMPQNSEPTFAGSKRQNPFLSKEDSQLSKVLLIRYPPSFIIEEDMIHNAMILFGEIERIKTFPDRSYAFVEFRSVEEAKRAKEGLQGKLFSDPRISIEYEIGVENNYNHHHIREFPYNHPILPSNNPVVGPSWRRSSPTPGIVSSPFNLPNRLGAWDVYDGRESKRSRSDNNTASFPIEKNQIGSSGSVRKFHGESDFIWRGMIAKAGNLVCRARCVPIGEWVGVDIPNVVDITARTGLDQLSRHYEESTGFITVFFLPDSEEDFASYTEFLRYLGTNNRAGVAKFPDGVTTMFLVPPSDFLTDVLKVSGPERLYGVILNNPIQSQYNALPHGEQARPVDYSRTLPEPTKLVQNPVNSFPALTPEIIASLTSSLLPTSSSTFSNSQSSVSLSLPQINSQLQYVPQAQMAPNSNSNSNSHFHQRVNNPYSQIHEPNLPPPVSSRSTAYIHSQQDFNNQYHQQRNNNSQDSVIIDGQRFYNPSLSNQVHGQQTYYTPHGSEADPTSQAQTVSSEAEAEKKERMKATLEIAARLLSQIQRNKSGQGAGL